MILHGKSLQNDSLLYNNFVKYIEFDIYTGEKNMQIDSDLLDLAIKNQIKEPTFRLYAWKPACVSLGRNQNETFLNKDFLKKKNIDVVKRLTGGRALLHDNELTYSYICPISFLDNGESVVNSYKEISQILIDGFKKLGINLEFPKNKRPHTKFDYCMSISTGADLCYKGKKLIGSAQFRKEGYILQHGSVLFDYNKDLIEQIFKENVDETSITCIKEIKPNLSIDDIINIFTL